MSSSFHSFCPNSGYHIHVSCSQFPLGILTWRFSALDGLSDVVLLSSRTLSLSAEGSLKSYKI